MFLAGTRFFRQVVQLNILSGKMAGTSWVARHFPVRIGRAQSSELRLEEPGVWEEHVLVQPDATRGFVLKTQPQTLARVNGQQTEQTLLRNGDVIELGSVSLQFWLAPARQSRLRFGEFLVWGAIIAVTLSQIGLLYWLLK